MKLSSILGLNARSQLFSYKYNSRFGKKLADSKILTERLLKKADIPAPQIYKVFREPKDIYDFNWDSLPSSFALKPSRGMGGEGIIIVKKRAIPESVGWINTQNQVVSVDDLKLHTMDILEGAFSMGNVPDVAFIQEYVGRNEAFRRYAFRGTPDIRIIVFNKVPIMAMLRLPTKESGGRANLHQGAIGVGVDIATGITTKAIWHGVQIHLKPGTNRKLHGIKIPNWTNILETAVKSQIASGLGYLGVDIVLHPEKGPMVLELNSQPGLQIQLANMEGLKKRLERVEDLAVRDAEHGVKIAKALFAERFMDRVKAEEGIKTLNSIEEIKIYKYKTDERYPVKARIDTGAFRSSIDRSLAESLGLLKEGNVLWKDKLEYKSALGLQYRSIVGVTFVLGGRRIKTSASVSDRSKMALPFLVGRNDLTGFLVSSEEKNGN
jgi:alpha-L-glutamate ligase-like protein